MPPKSTAPPSIESQSALLEALTRASEPLTAAQAVKLMPAELKISEKAAIPILEGRVSEDQLFAFPPKTAKGKPRFWDRDVKAISAAAAKLVMEDAELPLTAREITSRLETPFKLAEKDLVPTLDGFVADGTWHAIPPATAKGKPRYWNRDVVAYGELAMVDLLRKKGPQAEAAIIKAAKGLSPEQAKRAFSNAQGTQAIWKHPPVGRTKKIVWGCQPPAPADYFKEIAKQLTQVVKALTEAGVDRADLRRTMIHTAEQAGITFGNAGPTATAKPADVPTYDLIAQMKRIEPSAARGALITARDLRRATNLSKPEFDRAALELARQGRLSLHRHDYVSSLTEAEREDLVHDGRGTYYVGMALRDAVNGELNGTQSASNAN